MNSLVVDQLQQQKLNMKKHEDSKSGPVPVRGCLHALMAKANPTHIAAYIPASSNT